MTLSVALTGPSPRADSVQPRASHPPRFSPWRCCECFLVHPGKIKMLKVMRDRLQHLHARDAIFLLRHALFIPKLLYTFPMGPSPCFAPPELEVYLYMTTSYRPPQPASPTSTLVNRTLPEPRLPSQLGEVAWVSRACTVQLALSIFLASAAASSDLVHQILPAPLTRSGMDPGCVEARF